MDFDFAMPVRGSEQPEMSLTLKYLLENPALLQPPESNDDGTCSEKCKDDKHFDQGTGDLTSAYLGPQIWSDMLVSDDLKLEPVDLDEFLDMTGIDDEMSDLGLLMANSPPSKMSPFDSTQQQQQPQQQQQSQQQQQPQQLQDDPSLLVYHDMPSLISANSPHSKQVPSPSQYLCDANAPQSSYQHQPHQSPPRQVQTIHPMVQLQQSLPEQQHCALDNQQQHCALDNQQQYLQNLTLQQIRDQQFAIYTDICAKNKCYDESDQAPAAKRVCRRSPPQSTVVPIVQPVVSQHSPIANPAVVVQHSQNQINNHSPVNFSEQPQPTSHVQSAAPAARNLEPQSDNATDTGAAYSQISPIDIRIPSPKRVNYIPNSTDVIISTPQTEGDTINFDPSTRSFTEDELKPQPIVRKSKKMYVPTDNKDGKYWNRRNKNNVAAKRSREARRIKENQIAMRANYLEQENGSLKTEIAELRQELTRVMDLVRRYEKCFPKAS